MLEQLEKRFFCVFFLDEDVNRFTRIERIVLTMHLGACSAGR